MANKRPKLEEIVSKLRQVEVLMGQNVCAHAFALIPERHCVPRLVIDTVFGLNWMIYQKHTFAHTIFILIQLTVFI